MKTLWLLGRKKTGTFWRWGSPGDATLIGLTTTYDYNSLGRITRVTDALGNIMESVYDGNGKISKDNGYYKKQDEGYDTRVISLRQYNAADRLISDTDIYGNVTRFAYDESGISSRPQTPMAM